LKKKNKLLKKQNASIRKNGMKKILFEEKRRNNNILKKQKKGELLELNKAKSLKKKLSRAGLVSVKEIEGLKVLKKKEKGRCVK
jgi:hypothetical protein